MSMMTPLRRMTAALAVGTMMVIAAPAGAATTETYTVDNDATTSAVPSATFNLGTLLADSTIDLFASTSSVVGKFFFNLTNDFTSLWSGAFFTTGAESVSSTYSILATGNYSLTLSAISGENTLVSATVTAVPGPVAAAGLPAVLGLMGFAAWRRRQSAAAAA